MASEEKTWAPEFNIPDVPWNPQGRYLAIGKGGTEMEPWWEDHEIKDGKDIRDLSCYEDETFDGVYACHVLEHIPYEDAPAVVRELYRITKAGGRVRIAVPDLDKWTEGYQAGADWAHPRVLFGGHVDEHDHHRGFFTKQLLTEELVAAGFAAVKPFVPEYADNSLHPVSLNLQGIKPGRLISARDYAKKCCTVMTRPRVMFSDCADSIARLAAKYPMPWSRFGGAFWDQGMEKAIDNALALPGVEWLVCIDYDTVFDPSDFEKMTTILECAPEIDALAPMQSMRGNSNVLFGHDGPVKWTDTRGPVMEVTTAHFGFTLIRADVVRRMERPLFKSVPNEEGRWGENRIDADIYFWHNFRKAGGTVCMTPRVPVGHMQLMVTWPGEDFSPQYQHIQDYNDNGPPLSAQRWAAPWMDQYQGDDHADSE